MPIESFGGFEMSHNYEVLVNKGSVTPMTSPSPPQSDESYSALVQFSGLNSANVSLTLKSMSNDFITLGMYIRFTEVSPSTEQYFLQITDIRDGDVMKISVSTLGLLRVKNSSGFLVGSTLHPVLADTWYLLEVKVNINNSGSCDVYLDDNLVIEASSDFRLGGNNTNVILKANINNDFYLGSFYVLSDTSQPERIGPYSVLVYGYDEATATPNVTGSTLDNSTFWSHSSEIPGNDSNKSSYTASGDSGVVETSYAGGSYTAGPKNDSRIVTPKAGSWIYRASLQGIGGVANFKYGAGDGTDATVSGVLSTRGTVVITEDGPNMPSVDEYFQYGFGITAGFGVTASLKDVWCNILNQKFSPVRDNSFTLERKGPASRPRSVLDF